MSSKAKAQALFSRRKVQALFLRGQALFSRRRAQGMPINILVIAALALLVLFLVGAGFFTGWGKIGSGLGQLASSGSQSSVEALRIRCQTYCRQMDGALRNEEGASQFSFCTKYWNTADDGGIPEDHCWDELNDILKVHCSITLTTGAMRTIDKTVCESGGGGG